MNVIALGMDRLYSDQDPLALEFDICNCKLVREGHCGLVRGLVLYSMIVQEASMARLE